jgi:hypothetical protein
VLRTSLRVTGQAGVRFNWYSGHQTHNNHTKSSRCDRNSTCRNKARTTNRRQAATNTCKPIRPKSRNPIVSPKKWIKPPTGPTPNLLASTFSGQSSSIIANYGVKLRSYLANIKRRIRVDASYTDKYQPIPTMTCPSSPPRCGRPAPDLQPCHVRRDAIAPRRNLAAEP